MTTNDRKKWVAVLRTLHQSEKLNSVSEGAENLYRRLLEVVDDNGNYYATPAIVAGYACAHRMANGLTVAEVESRLSELVAARLVDTYGDGKYLHISGHYTKLRNDVNHDIRFPSPSATDAARMRAGDVTDSALQTETRQDKTETRQDIGVVAPQAAATDHEDGKPEPKAKKPRKLNVQAEAVKRCLDAYVAGRATIGLPYSGDPPAGAVVKWLGSQPSREAGVGEFTQCVEIAVKAHKLDPKWHEFPMTVPMFCRDLPRLNGAWLDKAQAEANKRNRGPGNPKTRQCYEQTRHCVSQGQYDYCLDCPEYVKHKAALRQRPASGGLRSIREIGKGIIEGVGK